MICASINTAGTLRMRATKMGSDAVLAQIVALVQQAQNTKAPGQRLADRAAFWLVLVALTGGIGISLVWVPIALRIGRGTLRKMRQNLGWAVGFNVIALPIAAGSSNPPWAGAAPGDRRPVDVRVQPHRRGQRPEAQTARVALPTRTAAHAAPAGARTHPTCPR